MRVRRFLGLFSVLVLTLSSGGTARAAQIVINNGLAPPNAENVIDGADDYSSDAVYVRNENCPPLWPSGNPGDPCAAPGDPTEVEVVSGGSWGYQLRAFDSSTITMTGGSGGDLYGHGSSIITMTGGSVGHLWAADSSIITLSGGTVGVKLWTVQSSTIMIEGTNFAVDGIPVPYGNLIALNGILTGMLGSGDSLNNVFWRQSSSANIRLVPEPSTALLVGFGLLGLLAAGRRRAA